MLLTCCLSGVGLLMAQAFLSEAPADAEERELTCFQSAAPYSPALDIRSDMAIVYGVDASFPERVAEWRRQGYAAAMMTGISWGGYDAYYQLPDGSLKVDEIQTRKDGSLLMHGNSTTVGYNVPSPEYVEFIKAHIDPAIDAKVRAIFLEEPEFWADAGWSASFKREWERFYGEPWQAPDSSPEAQYRASRLKYELYFNALREVMGHIKTRAADLGVEIECHVPTHSLINYAQWRIVSPESHLIDIPHLDGYIAQVWTGTARTQNEYKGVRKERTFETAFLEYGQMASMVRPTGKKVWFLADPVEDNPNRSWADYKRNYECTVVASLLWPEVDRFEVMPWPDRIFQGSYVATDMGDQVGGGRVGIPEDYATQILLVINALNEMRQSDIQRDMGPAGIGVIVSDTMMFQRGGGGVDPTLGGFFGLALPLLKKGIPVEPVQLENMLQDGALDASRVLFLTYEHQKPLRPDYHEALAAWVRQGGALVIVDANDDPYHGIREWWNDQGANDRTAMDDLLDRFGLDSMAAGKEGIAFGDGLVLTLARMPGELQQSPEGAEAVLALLRKGLEHADIPYAPQSHLLLRRGPYVIAAALDETDLPDAGITLEGRFINLFDHALPYQTELRVEPDERVMLYDLDRDPRGADTPRVAAAAARVYEEEAGDGSFRYTSRGPAGTQCSARVILPTEPRDVAISPEMPLETAWDAASGTLFVRHENRAEPVTVTCTW